MKITIVAGARPNFMKVASIINAFEESKNFNNTISYRLVHTGQHYDKNMSENFFSDLNIPLPNSNLKCSGVTQSEQTASIMINFEKELLDNKTDLVLVVGDVTSTMACAIVSKKMNIKVAHIEAGIRSGDMSMPGEINRIVTDSISDFYFTTSDFANQNLLKSGVSRDCIFFVGNTMIDTLLKNKSRFKKPEVWNKVGLKEKEYLIVTLHRPSNVDDVTNLEKLISNIMTSSHNIPIIFPVHPRTASKLASISLSYKNLYLVEPMGYLEFNYLVNFAKGVITDSGGITEETTVLGIPCITLRDSTERPETVTIGTNELIGTNSNSIFFFLDKLFSNNWKKGGIPELWDGKAGERIVSKILQL